MTYYKLIKNNTFIGVATSDAFLRYQTKHRIMLSVDVQEAQYIMCNDDIYHAVWMSPENSEKRGIYETVDVIEITKEEYDTLYEAEEYEIPNPKEIEQPEEEIIIDEIKNATLDYLIDRKIKQMENACKNVITSGFDITFDDKDYHFSLTIQDQLNIITLGNLASANNIGKFPYHADGQLCTYFTAYEISAIVKQMQMTIAKNTTYFNSLKAYIESLTTIESIAAVYWGMDIPVKYQSEVYKTMFGKD